MAHEGVSAVGPAEENEVPDLADVGVGGGRIVVAGLSIAGATMLVAVMFVALLLRMPGLLLIAAPLTVVFLLTAGLAVAWAGGRLTAGMTQRNASLTFFAAGLLAGGLWGYPIFLIMDAWLAGSLGNDPNQALAVVGAVYTASTAGLGALVGRYFGPWAATRPSLVRWAAGTVLLVAVMGVVILSGLPAQLMGV